jgi:glutamyl-tRNA reductase
VIAVVGLSFRTAPISLRERIAFDAAATVAVLSELHSGGDVSEVMLLSTCNRTELVAASDLDESSDALMMRLKSVFLTRLPESGDHLYLHSGTSALQHVFQVVSSLDSLVVGEPQILGQFKNAFDLACKQGTVGTHLRRVVARALRAAKRVRHETRVGAGQVSIPTTALELARQIFGEIVDHTAVLVGTGEMGELVAQLLQRSGARLILVGRNTSRLAELQTRFHADGRPMDQLENSLSEADVVVTSTSSPTPLIDSALMRRVMRTRRGRDLFVVDVAVPRDVSPDVDQLEGVYRYDVDDLAAVVARSRGSRAIEADRAQSIVAEEVERFERWVEGEQVTPFILSMRQHIAGVLHRELGRSLRGRLKHLADNERLHLERMIDAAVNKLMHEPTVQLRKMASENPDDLDQVRLVIEEMFGMSTDEIDSDQLNAEHSEPSNSRPSSLPHKEKLG